MSDEIQTTSAMTGRLISPGRFIACRNLGCDSGQLRSGLKCPRCGGYGVEPGSWIPPVYEEQS